MNVALLLAKTTREALEAPCCTDTTKRVCYTCRHTIAVRLDWLAHNIAVGAMLCRAHEIGGREAMNTYWGDENWRPGSGDPVPGGIWI